MAEMVELVIKIPKERLNEIIKVANTMFGSTMLNDIEDAILDGKILPKGHSRLIEADSMKRIDAIQRGDFNSIESIRAWIDIMPTIIEADKAESEE